MNKIENAKNLRYKRPALESLGYEAITQELQEISDACAEIHYYTDSDEDSLVNALDGDEDEAYEFRIAFSDFESKAEQLYSNIQDCGLKWDEFDDCTVALIGNRYKTLGFDAAEEDYYSLTEFEQQLAQQAAGKRLMQMTKAEMISSVGQCFGITLAFLDLRQGYDYLKSAIDVLRSENTSLLQTVREIDELYMDAEREGFTGWKNAANGFNDLLKALPEQTWLN